MITKVTIDNKEYEVNDSSSILVTCQKLGIFIPNLCYLKGFTPTGMCGLCVVEIQDKGVALSCRTNIENGMRITTNSEQLQRIRQNNIKRLLKTHHINCFNCNKNGFCQFQKQVFKTQTKDLETLEFNYSKMPRCELAPNLYYDARKCINCMKCVKFLNTVCDCHLKSIKDLAGVENTEIDGLLNTVDICPTAALSTAPKFPTLSCAHIETYDITDVFTPKITIDTYNNTPINVRLVDTYIKDKCRLEILNLPARTFQPAEYDQAILNISNFITSQKREKNIFVIGDNIDIITFAYLKIISEKFENVALCFDDDHLPTGIEPGIKRSDMISMDLALFLEADSYIDKLHFTFNQNRFIESLPLNINDKLAGLDANDLSKYRAPYLIVHSSTFRKHDADLVLQKIKDLQQYYIGKYNIRLNTRFVPRALSQMLISGISNYISLNELFNKFTKHDILSLCIVGDLNDAPQISPDIYAVSNSVFTIPNSINIPARHYTEDEAYYVNVFKETRNTRKVISSDLKSNREFVTDIAKNIFVTNFDSIKSEVHKYIKNNFAI